MKKIAFILLFVIPVVFTSCKKDNSPVVNPLPDSTEEIQVPNDFKWKTTQDIRISVKGSSDGLVHILSSKGKVYWKVFIAANQPADIDLNIPTYETSLQLKYQGQTVSLELTSNSLNYEFQ